LAASIREARSVDRGETVLKIESIVHGGIDAEEGAEGIEPI
jgi:hypothetical protein